MTTNPIANAVARLTAEKRDEAISAVNAYGKTSPIAPEYVDQIAQEIEAWGLGRTMGLSIAAAGAVRSCHRAMERNAMIQAAKDKTAAARHARTLDKEGVVGR